MFITSRSTVLASSLIAALALWQAQVSAQTRQPSAATPSKNANQDSPRQFGGEPDPGDPPPDISLPCMAWRSDGLASALRPQSSSSVPSGSSTFASRRCLPGRRAR